MKVAFIGMRGVPATYSGFETAVEQIGARMAARGHDVRVFCRSSHYAEQPETHRGMSLSYLPAVRQKHLETLSHTALSAIQSSAGTAIVCMGVGNAPVVRLLELRGRRLVFNVDGADWQRSKWGGIAARYLRYCERIAAGASSALIADAEAVRRYYRQTYDRDTELITYGAEPPRDAGTRSVEEFGLAPGSYLLWVGRLVPENGAHDFLEGVSLAELNVPAIVVGDASYQDDYKASLRERAPSQTIFSGYQFGSAYQQLSHHAGIYVLAAQVGGTHPVLVEQMAAGNCILARDTESNREALGDAGLVWDSPVQLAELLRAMWADADARRRLGDRARRRAAACYSWERVTDSYLDLCERSLRHGR